MQRLFLVVLVLSSCTLPGPESRSAKPRNALTAFFVSWFEKDTKELVSQLCTDDQERLARLEKSYEQLRKIYTNKNTIPPKDLVAPDNAIYLALGTAPKDPTSLRTRVALMRTDESKQSDNSLTLGSWLLERSQKGHLVCLPQQARVDLDTLLKAYEVHLVHLQSTTPVVEPVKP